MTPSSRETRILRDLQNYTMATDTKSALCIFYPARGAPEARRIPTDLKAMASLFPQCDYVESKCIKRWELYDSVFRGVTSHCWMVWVYVYYNEWPSGAANAHVPWIKGDAFLTLTVEGEVGDGEIETFDLDFTELATIEEFGRLLESYNGYRAADARAMAGMRSGVMIDPALILGTPAAQEALAAMEAFQTNQAISDPAARLGITASV